MASLLACKDWTSGDWRDVYAAVSKHIALTAASGSPIAANASWEKGADALARGSVHGVISDGYLIIYAVGGLWCSPGTLLYEMLYIRIRPSSGNLRGVLRALEHLAAFHGCRGVVVGNGVRRKGLVRVYERDGYVPVTTQMFKEIPDGIKRN